MRTSTVSTSHSQCKVAQMELPVVEVLRNTTLQHSTVLYTFINETSFTLYE